MPTGKILLVDDDESLRTVLHKSLQKIGYAVTPAENGRVALDLFGQQKFDLVISDIRMPEMDGISLTKLIRAQSRIPIILITGFSDLVETKQAHELGANDFLPKPFDRAELEASISRCLNISVAPDAPPEFCHLSVEDFICGRQIMFNIYLQLNEDRFIKVAHKGEDLSIDRIRSYKEKGIRNLYLRKEDFRTYVGFSLKLSEAAKKSNSISLEKKRTLVRHTAEVILTNIKAHGLDEDFFSETSSFVEAVVETIADDKGLLELLDSLRNHTNYQYAHSVGVCFYSVVIAKQVGWDLPTNRFKVALGGLIHDVGEKEVNADILTMPRSRWTLADVNLFEGHPLRGIEVLSDIRSVPDDVLQIVKQHHEDCLSKGFPSRLKTSQIHPMAKLIAVADLFCELAIPNPHSDGHSAPEALIKMTNFYSDRLDKKFFRALKESFRFDFKATG